MRAPRRGAIVREAESAAPLVSLGGPARVCVVVPVAPVLVWEMRTREVRLRGRRARRRRGP